MKKIKIICDTNFLYTDTSDFLSNKELKDTIESSKHIPEYNVEWILPSIVRDERRFQISKSFKKNINWIKRIERLTNKKYNITESTIDKSVNNLIEKEVKHIGFKLIKLTSNNVDWDSIIHKSVNRITPFEDNKKEKGFRDAMIAETSFQYFKRIKKSKYSIVFLTQDDVLANYLRSYDFKSTNLSFKVIPTIGELKNYLNVLKSKLDIKIISEFQDLVSELFYTEDNDDSIVIKENIIGQIEEKFKEELDSLPEHVDSKDSISYTAKEPVFLNMDGKSQVWNIVIEESFKLFIEENIFPRYPEKDLSRSWTPALLGRSMYGSLSGSINTANTTPYLYDKYTYVGSGTNLFDIKLKTVFDKDKKLLNYKILNIEFRENDFSLIHTTTNT